VTATTPGENMKPQHVAVFLGSDLSSHLIANRLIRVLTAGGHSVSVHYTYASANPRAARELRELFFVERRLLTEYAYPYLDKHGEPCPGRANSPQGWRALSLPLVHVEETENVNDTTFIGMVAERGYDVSVSIRCYQKFGRSLISTLTADGAVFTNLHPGILPAYRGVLTFSRALFHGDAMAGYTLHHVNERWDAGSIIAKRSQQLDPSASVLENMCRQGRLAAQLVVDLVECRGCGEAVAAVAQDEAAARYYTHPTSDELAAMRGKGIRLCDAAAAIDVIVAEYTRGGSGLAERLRQHLTEALIHELAELRGPGDD
jgi:folate-dependent phosphoribosylglycinamide formyltransferase PurN